MIILMVVFYMFFFANHNLTSYNCYFVLSFENFCFYVAFKNIFWVTRPGDPGDTPVRPHWLVSVESIL